MVVERAVLLKAALIEAARHKGAVTRLDGGEHVVLRAVGVLHAHVPGVAVKALAHHVDVAAQADGGISDAVLLKERHEVVGDVALGNTTQVELGLGVGEGDGGAVDRDGAIVHMGECRLDVLICGLDLVVKIPEARDGADGDVKEPVGFLGVADGCLDDLGGLVRDFHGLAACIVDVPDIRALHGARELVLKVGAAVGDLVHDLFAALGADIHDSVEDKERRALHLGRAVGARGARFGRGCRARAALRARAAGKCTGARDEGPACEGDKRAAVDGVGGLDHGELSGRWRYG